MKNLIKHLSLNEQGEIFDRTGLSTMHVMGVAPRPRLHDAVNIFVTVLDTKTQIPPAYLAAKVLGYTVPEKSGKCYHWHSMHPENIKYKKPSNAWKFQVLDNFPRYCGRYSEDPGYIQHYLLGKYLEGAVLQGCGSVSSYYMNPGTVSASKAWQATQVSARRGLALLASSLLVSVVGDEDILENAGLSQGGRVEINSLLGIGDIVKRVFNWEDLTSTPDVMLNGTVDLSKLPKALKPDGLWVPYRKQKDFGTYILENTLLSSWYENDMLLANHSSCIGSDLSSWEFKRQLSIFLETYSWETEQETTPLCRKNSQIPQHLLDRIDSTPIPPCKGADLLQRTLKERKRNLEITYRTTGPKKQAERLFKKAVESENLTADLLHEEYMLWRAPIDYLFGGVKKAHALPKDFELKMVVPNSQSDEPSITWASTLVPVINYLESIGRWVDTVTLYMQLMRAVRTGDNSDSLLSVTQFSRSSSEYKKHPLGCNFFVAPRNFSSPYNLATVSDTSHLAVEELTYPWVGNRIETLIEEGRVALSESGNEILELAKNGNLLPRDHKLYWYFRELAKQGLY